MSHEALQLPFDQQPPGIRRALVIDDHAEVGELLRLVLASSGIEVRSSADGQDIAALIDGWPPDVVLLDLRLPGRSGLELIGQLAPTHAPIIAMSAAPDERAARDAGCVEFLAKPFSPGQVLDAIERWVRPRP